jgi:hypothetical protein
MRNVRLKPTHVPDLYRGDDGRMYARVGGAEERCSRCGKWSHDIFCRGRERICPDHLRVTSRTRIRVTATFALRVLGREGRPPARVVRRGDELDVLGPPVLHRGFDRFGVAAGHILVPRSRWAWATVSEED